MNLDLQHEWLLDGKFAHETMDKFHEDNRKCKIKYCKEKLNRECSNCDQGCDDKQKNLEENSKDNGIL